MTGESGPVVVIPAYQPCERLLDVLRALELPVVVVDDGSGDSYSHVFELAAEMGHVEVVAHAVNLGKGAALRTGLNHALCRYRRAVGVVTADADGQHTPADIARVAEALEAAPGELVLGVRGLGKNTPLRSRVGNSLTRVVFRALQGKALRDTQTGLRGVPRALAETMLGATTSGYEFELDMLIVAKQLCVPVREVDIATLYIEGNASSHFHPIFDSMRIYFLLLRFSAASLFTALCDNLVFYAVFVATGVPLTAQVVGRLGALLVNYRLNKSVVFLFRRKDSGLLARYLTVVLGSGMISYLGFMAVHQLFGLPVQAAKLALESLMFLANFALMRDFVFVLRGGAPRTDWTRYYESVPAIARVTRKYTERRLLEAVRRAGLRGPVICEIGGGNSCFLEAVAREAMPEEYHVVDTDRLGLDLLRGRGAVLHEASVLGLRMERRADFVFSVGLIEHFDRDGTTRAVQAHFENAKPGGWVLMSFPCPTGLYRVTRAVLEALGLWRFPDERPLERGEIVAAATGQGEVVWEQTLWPLVLTQHMMLFRVAR